MKTLRFCLFVLVCIGLTACLKNTNDIKPIVQKLLPQTTFESIKLQSITLDSIAFSTNLNIANPYPFDLSLKNMQVNVYYQDTLISSTSGKTITLTASSTSKVSQDSSLAFREIATLIQDYTIKDSLPLAIQVKFSVPLPKAASDIDIYTFDEKYDFVLPTFNPELTNKSLDMQGGKIQAVFNLRNKTKSSFSLDDISYDYVLLGKEFHGKAKANKLQNGSVDMTFEIDALDTLKSLLGQKSYDQKIKIQTGLQLESLPYTIPLRIEKEF